MGGVMASQDVLEADVGGGVLGASLHQVIDQLQVIHLEGAVEGFQACDLRGGEELVIAGVAEFFLRGREERCALEAADFHVDIITETAIPEDPAHHILVLIDRLHEAARHLEREAEALHARAEAGGKGGLCAAGADGYQPEALRGSLPAELVTWQRGR